MGMGKIMGVILAAVILVAFMAIMPTIITSTETAAAATGIDTATASIVDLIPLVAAVGGIAAAGLVAISALKGSKG